MICYECASRGLQRPAVGMCHHCGAGICRTHAVEVPKPLTVVKPVYQTVVLPLKARQLLCPVCKQALDQLSR